MGNNSNGLGREPTTGAMKEQPNFLFVITDQQRADWLGVTGHPILQTPNIDSIADGGTIFDRFYVANPVCMPNRAALMTGRHTSVNGVRTNGVPLPRSANTFVKRLAEEGYDTALLGKAHHQTFSDVKKGDTTRETESPSLEAKQYYSETDYSQEDPQTWAPGGQNEVETPYYGFSHVDLVTMHGDICSGNYGVWLREQHSDPASLQGPANQLPHNYSCPQAIRTKVPEELYHTRYIENIAADYLKDPARHDNPFFAFVSFPDPHHPYNPPGKYWDMYDPDDFDVPENFENDPGSKLLRWLREEQGTIRGLHMGPNPVSKREIQEAMALSAGMITMIDDAVGAILEALKENGLADNTIVIFTSDHGELMGDHGLLFKGPLHFQSTIRVPMVWNDPRKKQVASSSALASTMDFAPTIMAEAGVEPYHGIQGLDISSTFTGADNVRDGLLIEEDSHAPMCFKKPPRVRTIQTERHRMSLVIGEQAGELYDLKDDPNETRNMFDAPESAGLRATLMEQLADLMGQADDSSPRPWRNG